MTSQRRKKQGKEKHKMQPEDGSLHTAGWALDRLAKSSRSKGVAASGTEDRTTVDTSREAHSGPAAEDSSE